MRSPRIRTLVIIVLFPIAGLLQAQVAEIGIKGGPALAQLVSSAWNNRPIAGMVVGVYAPVPVNPRLTFQPELAIATMGTSYGFNREQVDILRTAYLCAPLTLRWKVGPKFQIAGGLQPGYLLRAWRNQDHITVSAMHEVKPFDMAFVCGVSMRPSMRTDITLRYVYGMSSVLANDHVMYPTNRALQLTIGLRMKRFKGASEYRRRSRI